MAKNRKEVRTFHISVEGKNCEVMYFEHLQGLINASECNKYNAKMNCKKLSPMAFAKRNQHLGTERAKKGNKTEVVPYFHIQDIEDAYSEEHQKVFFTLLDEIDTTVKTFGLRYELGYSNYTFELWMLLHVIDAGHTVGSRRDYLPLINRHFNRCFLSLDDFKKSENFKSILDEFVTLDSVKLAVKRAESLREQKEGNGEKSEEYKKFRFFKDNPDTSVHTIIKIIFAVCGIRYC